MPMLLSTRQQLVLTCARFFAAAAIRTPGQNSELCFEPSPSTQLRRKPAAAGAKLCYTCLLSLLVGLQAVGDYVIDLSENLSTSPFQRSLGGKLSVQR